MPFISDRLFNLICPVFKDIIIFLRLTIWIFVLRSAQTSLRQDVVNSLSSIPTALITPFADVADLGDDLQKSFSDLHYLVYEIKQAYEDLRVG